jgi:outer membrane protein assembly factor BamB
MKKLALLCLTMAFATLSAPAADWPQWQGPTRDNISTEKGLLATIPAGGPKLLWQYSDCGSGFSSPSIVGDRVFMGGIHDKNEVLFCLDAKTGKPLWDKPATIGPAATLDRGDGPRGSPSVDGEFVYLIGGSGGMVCVEAATGKEVWKKHLVTDLGGSRPNWGYSESPLVDGDLVLCTPGGAKGTVAALNKKTGEVVWRTKEIGDPAAYTSLITADFAGGKHYVGVTGSGSGSVIGIEPKTGKLLWREKEKVAVNGIATIPTPVYHDGHVYMTSDYQAGCSLIKLEKGTDGISSKLVYSNKTMQNHHGGIVLLDGHIYGATGNANNARSGNLVCQDFLTGKEVYTDKKFPEMASLTVADGKLFLYGQDTGLLIMGEVSPKGFKELGRFTIPAESKIPRGNGRKMWTHPVVANGRLYLRDLDLLFCFDISAK